MEDLKTSINNVISQLEEKFTVFEKLTNASDRERELQDMDTLINQAEDDYAMFEKQMIKIKTGKQNYGDDAEFFDEKIIQFRKRYTELRNNLNKPLGVTLSNPVAVSSSKNMTQSATLMSKLAEGDSQISKGKEKLENIRKRIVVINEELTGIEEEIELQREKLERVKEKVSDTHSVVKQSKKVLDNVSSILYHDTLLKILIVLISIAIIGIVAAAIVVKVKKDTISAPTEYTEKINGTDNFDDIDEYMFMNLAKGTFDYMMELKNQNISLKIL